MSERRICRPIDRQSIRIAGRVIVDEVECQTTAAGSGKHAANEFASFLACNAALRCGRRHRSIQLEI